MSEKHPIYSVSQTLMGGNPDCNRRTIYRHADKADIPGTEVCTFNYAMKPWTPQMAAELTAVLKALRGLEWATG